MNTKRLFIGTFIDNKIIVQNYDEIKRTFEKVCKGKWVEERNLHFTYRFIGDLEVNLIDKLKEKLKNYLVDYASSLSFSSLSAFPNVKKPRVLFIKAHCKDDILNKIFRGIDNSLKEFGIESETTPFRPHITLLRIREFKNPEFSQAVQKFEGFEFGKMDYFKVNLIESNLTSSGPIYKII